VSPVKADFEEKVFEGAANAELGRDRGRVFTPGQVEEAALGYDAAAVPDAVVSDVLERITGIRLLSPVWLTPNWWLRCPRRPPASVLPSRFASLLLQYKRPTWQLSPAEPLYSAHGGAFFRFAFSPEQHRTLVRLDEALNDEAFVRYAAPCSISRKELEQWQLDAAVLEHTNFVSPRRIGLRHKAWTYRTPGQRGFRNEYEEGDDGIPSETVEELISLLAARGAQQPTLGSHLAEMLRLIAGDDVASAVEAAVADYGEAAPTARVAAAVRMRMIGLALQESGSMWWLYQLDEADDRQAGLSQ
jgi:hypothetical protein